MSQSLEIIRVGLLDDMFNEGKLARSDSQMRVHHWRLAGGVK